MNVLIFIFPHLFVWMDNVQEFGQECTHIICTVCMTSHSHIYCLLVLLERKLAGLETCVFIALDGLDCIIDAKQYKCTKVLQL